MRELENLVNMGRLVQKFLPQQADIDKILKIIQWKILKGTHLPVTVKEIQAGYQFSSYFNDMYMYLAQNKLSSNFTAIKKIKALKEKYILLDWLLFKIVSNLQQRSHSISHTRGMCWQNNHFISFKFICRAS